VPKKIFGYLFTTESPFYSCETQRIDVKINAGISFAAKRMPFKYKVRFLHAKTAWKFKKTMRAVIRYEWNVPTQNRCVV